MRELPLPIAELEHRIGYSFKNTSFINRALTHSSYANEHRDSTINLRDNERMEFLGDSVLSLITSEYLFNNHPEMHEGEMSKIRAATVCEKALDEFAREIDLGDFLLLGHGEDRNGGRNRASILSDAFEAILAAIFLDGGIEPVKDFLLPLVITKVNNIIETDSTKDYKTALQQIIQQEQGELLTYVIVDESGPSHMRMFEAEAHLNSNVIGRGRGKSKREAEQMAAREALTLFGN